ncbi:peptidoglycan DD-metalloendopeptidase family protein [Vibrio sp.]|nr:peptidoglycan DD-metalloendopeptidase family protein [Vibrio sp.]
MGVFSLGLGGCVMSSAPEERNYDTMKPGSYRGSYYQVKRGDTLYFIAYLTGKNVNEIIAANRLTPPYTLHPGQKLKLWSSAYVAPSYGKAGSAVAGVGISPPVTELSRPAPKVPIRSSSTSSSSSSVAASTAVVGAVATSAATAAAIGATSTSATSTAANVNKTNVNKANTTKANSNAINNNATKKVEPVHKKEYVSSKVVQSKPVIPPASTNDNNQPVKRWLWPAKGRVIETFSSGNQGNKGIDIAGQRGQAVLATAAGVVVYSGNALRGYGNLVIVKHNDDYISAYAHNDTLLVKEGQNIASGQKIATMGNSGTSSTRLHFEIRYQGKSVNPMRYLP